MVPLDERDFSLDYGFYGEDTFGPMGGFYKETGEGMDHIPVYMNHRGIKTPIGVYWDVKEEVIIDRSLSAHDGLSKGSISLKTDRACGTLNGFSVGDEENFCFRQSRCIIFSLTKRRATSNREWLSVSV